MSTALEPEPGRRSGCVWEIVVVIGVLLFLAALLFPAVQAAREAARRASCIGDLKGVGLAMHNYRDAKGCFPPAYLVDVGGQPAHSWRVLLLPYWEETALYEQCRFNEAWNSPHNLAVTTSLFPIGMSATLCLYHCPNDDSNSLDTSKVMVVGKGTASDGPTSRRFKEFTDGLAHTILVAEMSESGIHWSEPRDLKFDEMSFKIDDAAGNCIRSKHPTVANVGMSDGSAMSIRKDIDPEVLKGLMTIAGGEPFPADLLDY